MTPFLKWPGGKRWFVAAHAGVLPSTCDLYIEPFLGSGAVFFHLQPRKAILGDTNADLIAAYRGIRRDWRRVQALLAEHQKEHGRRYYYRIRTEEPADNAGRAARLVYLNRTCFNGIYRVNRDGQFNVPKGTRASVVFPTDDFQAVARLLRGARLIVSDFEPLIDMASAEHFVFADPPYTVRHNTNAFIRYNEDLFSWKDQIRLADALARARERGARIVATNANHPCVRELYARHAFELRTISRFSSISAGADSRNTFEELLILS